MTASPVEYLPLVDDHPEVGLDHPEVVEPWEEAAGLTMWQSVRDVDDHSNGVEPPATFATLLGATPNVGRDRALQRAQIVRECLLRHGVPEVSIELQDGRPGTGDTWNLLKPVSVFSHHIASKPTVDNPTPGLSLVKRGRSDLPGPLCNGTAGVDLVYRIICLGMANHPGYGGPLTLNGPVGNYAIPKDNARAYAWGTEYEGGYTDEVWDREYTNRRTGKSMTFREFMGRANAGLVEAIWLINGMGKTPEPGADLSGYHGEHKTWAPGRKPDRRNYTTDSGRAEIRKYDQEDDVSAADVWKHPIGNTSSDKKGDTLSAAAMLQQTHNRAGDARANSARALAQSQRNAAAIRKVTESLPEDTAREVIDLLAEDTDPPQTTPDNDPAEG